MAPIYDYKALSPAGKPQKGIVEAENQKAARAKIKKQGLMVTEMTEKTAHKPSNQGSLPFIGNRVGGQEITMMTRQLASLVKSNIPLVEALNAMVDQTDNDKLKVVLAQVRQDVNEGSSFAKAISTHPKIFDTIFINMIEAGESSGTLGMVLVRLAELKEAQMRLRSKVISGMTYPALMMFIGASLIIAIFTFVIPKLTKVFESINKPIPMVTQVIMAMSDTLVNWWFVFAGIGFAMVTAFRRWVSTPAGAERWDVFKLKLPLIGPLVRMIAVTRFSNTMATLLASGVPILTSMAIARNLVGNIPIAKAITTARENITEGQSIADPLKRSGEFPPMMIHMISIGEKTGELPAMLTNIAETYEEQVNTKIEQMTSLLEPLMIVLMGGVVGFMVISVFLPLMEIMNVNNK